MFTVDETERIRIKALEQAKQQAALAHAELEPLILVASTWPFLLTEADVEFLRNCVPGQPISPA